MTDETYITVDEFEAAGEMKIELVDGDLYVGNRSLGHGALARAVLGLGPRRDEAADEAQIDAVADEIVAWFSGVHVHVAERRTFLRAKLQQLIADVG